MNLTKSQLFWKNHIKEYRKSNLSQACMNLKYLEKVVFG